MDFNDKRAADNLKAIWSDHKKRTGDTQAYFADKLGCSQSNFAIYLNGHQPIGLKMMIKLAESLECNCSDIRPEVGDKY